jgi:hypothetical protein
MMSFKSREAAYASIVDIHEKAGYAYLLHPTLKHVESVGRHTENYVYFVVLNSREEYKYSYPFFSEQDAEDLVNAYQYLLMEI